MEPFTLQWAAERLEARIIGDAGATVTSVCTDSRTITPGALFFALQGEQSDGHRYVAQALANGAAGAVVSREIEEITGPLLLVPDTLLALGDLARHYRRQFSVPVVGITGSVGKTSTKEMTATVLRTRYNTLANEKNYNNEIGVPLTLFQLNKTHEVAVIEMGMRGLGQIDRLAEIAEPTIGVITNIGYAHMELLGSRENIAQAKSELLVRLPNDGVAVLPFDDFFFDYLQHRVPKGCKLVDFGTVINAPSGGGLPDVRASHITLENGRIRHALIRTDAERAILTLQAPGTHHLPNALAALAVAISLGVSLGAAIEALSQWEGAEGRMVWRCIDDNITILDDNYNAGPESMKAALETIKQITTQGRRVAVLGDMKELGDFAAQAHSIVATEVFYTNLDVLVTVGSLSTLIDAEVGTFGEIDWLPEMHHFDDATQAAAAIRSLVRSGDTILVKGSRAMEMEKIVAALTGEPETGAHG